MNIRVQCLYTKGWLDIAKVVVPNIVNYCRKHNYSWWVQLVDEPYNDFEKLIQIQRTFNNNEADIIFSVDCDLLITNYNYRIEGFIEDEYDFFITKDVNGVNGGSFIILNTQWSRDFVNWLLKQRGKRGVHCEQDAIREYMNEYRISPIKILNHPSINSYKYELYPEFKNITHEQGQWEGGDFVLHLPGLGMDKRLEILKNTKVIE